MILQLKLRRIESDHLASKLDLESLRMKQQSSIPASRFFSWCSVKTFGELKLDWPFKIGFNQY